MKNSKKAWIIFRNIITILFVLYLISYFQVSSGNYLNSNTQKTILTQQKIKEFETDVKNGEFIDIKKYTEDTYINSNNKISDIGYEIGESLTDLVSVKIVDFVEFIGKFIS